MSTPPDSVNASAKVKSRASSADDPKGKGKQHADQAEAEPIPYTLASPRVRENVPKVMVAPATPPDTPARNRITRDMGLVADELGTRETSRESSGTEYFTPITPTRPTILIGTSMRPELPRRPPPPVPVTPPRPPLPHRTPPPLPPRTPQTPRRNSIGLDVSLTTPTYGTPPVTPRTEAAEMGFNVRPGASRGSTAPGSPYGEGLGLGLPSLGKGAKGSPRANRMSVGPSRRESIGPYLERDGEDIEDSDPLGLRARAGNPLVARAGRGSTKPRVTRRPSEKPLMEGEDSGAGSKRRQAREITFEDHDEVLDRNKRLVDAIGPFVYAFGLLERPKGKGKGRARSTEEIQDEETGEPLHPPLPLYKRFSATSGGGWRLSSGSSWLSAFTSSSTAVDPKSRTASQATGSTFVNSPAFGFSAQVLQTHTLSTGPDPIGPENIREAKPGETLWDALHSLPRGDLDAYQPLVNLSTLFRGRTVPAIDFFTTKLALLSALIDESRSGGAGREPPASTAFVTFKDPRDARRAVKELAAHPKNMLACVVTPAPDVRDIDWGRAMKSAYTGEFVKDWVVNLGVW